MKFLPSIDLVFDSLVAFALPRLPTFFREPLYERQWRDLVQEQVLHLPEEFGQGLGGMLGICSREPGSQEVAARQGGCGLYILHFDGVAEERLPCHANPTQYVTVMPGGGLSQ